MTVFYGSQKKACLGANLQHIISQIQSLIASPLGMGIDLDTVSALAH